jgi:o-succinylbenzoate synthase
MNVAAVTWTAFKVPFRVPLRTAKGVLKHREGLLIQIRTDAGLEGLGEASLHPFSSCAACLHGLAKILAALAPGLIGTKAEAWLQGPRVLPPSLAFGIETALLDVLAQQKGISIAGLLGGPKRNAVEVNALIASESANGAALEAKAAKEAGFGCVKLKVGAASSLQEEKERVAAVREALGPWLKIRLDANGAWGVQEAILAIRSLERYGIELIEQPVSASDLEGLKHVQKAVQTMIAADEAITDVQSAARVIEIGAASVLVLKPMVLGGLRKALQVASLAQKAGLEAYVTTTLDSSVGIAAALQLACMLPQGGPACGLATGGLLDSDIVVQPPGVSAGTMALLDLAGLGVKQDEHALFRHTLFNGHVGP